MPLPWSKFELLTIAVLALSASAGGWLGYRHFGSSGFLIGFIAGGFALPTATGIAFLIAGKMRKKKVKDK